MTWKRATVRRAGKNCSAWITTAGVFDLTVYQYAYNPGDPRAEWDVTGPEYVPGEACPLLESDAPCADTETAKIAATRELRALLQEALTALEG